MATYRQSNRNIPHLWDIFGKPEDTELATNLNKLQLDGSASGHDSAISVSSASDEDIYAASTTNKKKKRCSRRDLANEPEVKYLERHLSMKKTIRKKIMRDLQKAFVEDPNEFRVDMPPEHLKSEINVQSLSFVPSGKKKGKKTNESNFLDFLRTGSGDGKTSCSVKNTRKGSRDDDGDSGHGSPTRDESDEKTSFWRRLTMKGGRGKR